MCLAISNARLALLVKDIESTWTNLVAIFASIPRMVCTLYKFADIAIAVLLPHCKDRHIYALDRFLKSDICIRQKKISLCVMYRPFKGSDMSGHSRDVYVHWGLHSKKCDFLGGGAIFNNPGGIPETTYSILRVVEASSVLGIRVDWCTVGVLLVGWPLQEGLLIHRNLLQNPFG